MERTHTIPIKAVGHLWGVFLPPWGGHNMYSLILGSSRGVSHGVQGLGPGPGPESMPGPAHVLGRVLVLRQVLVLVLALPLAVVIELVLVLVPLLVLV